MEGIKKDLNRVNELIADLENGKLNVEQLVELCDAARSVYEKSTILKYKAFEEFSGVKVATVSIPEVEEPQIEEPPVAPIMHTLESDEEEIKEDETTFDFGIFDESEEHEELDIIDGSIDMEESEAENMDPAPELNATIDEHKDVEEHLSITKVGDEGNEEEITVTHTRSTFYDKLQQQDNSLAARIAGGKLDTLIGAFGLNQRLQFINELFDGSSDSFSEAIKTLDAQNGMSDAKSKIDTYANQFNWDPQDETVVEFISYVNRRYA